MSNKKVRHKAPKTTRTVIEERNVRIVITPQNVSIKNVAVEVIYPIGSIQHAFVLEQQRLNTEQSKRELITFAYFVLAVNQNTMNSDFFLLVKNHFEQMLNPKAVNDEDGE